MDRSATCLSRNQIIKHHVKNFMINLLKIWMLLERARSAKTAQLAARNAGFPLEARVVFETSLLATTRLTEPLRLALSGALALLRVGVAAGLNQLLQLLDQLLLRSLSQVLYPKP